MNESIRHLRNCPVQFTEVSCLYNLSCLDNLLGLLGKEVERLPDYDNSLCSLVAFLMIQYHAKR